MTTQSGCRRRGDPLDGQDLEPAGGRALADHLAMLGEAATGPVADADKLSSRTARHGTDTPSPIKPGTRGGPVG